MYTCIDLLTSTIGYAICVRNQAGKCFVIYILFPWYLLAAMVQIAGYFHGIC